VTNQGTNSGYISIANGLNGNLTLSTVSGAGAGYEGKITLRPSNTLLTVDAATIFDHGILLLGAGANFGYGLIAGGKTTGYLQLQGYSDGLGTTGGGQILIPGSANSNISITPNGTGDVYLNADTVRVGDSNTAATITTSGTGDLTLNTNAGTNSGSITIANGVNGNISLTPNGTGDVLLVADTIQVGDSNTAAIITTNGTGNLTLSTNSGTNSGTIAIANGVNGNISITPNGTGIVVLDGLNWPITGGTANYVLTTNGSTQTSWSQVSLTAGVTGTLPLANGGTNATTARDAWDNLTTYTSTNGGAFTLTNTSSYTQHIYGGSAATVTLPSTATMTFGEGFYITNTSGATATVNTSTSATVGTIPTGGAMRISVNATNSDAAVAWTVMRSFTNITGTGSAVLDTSPTISGATLSGTTTSTGVVILKDIRETVYTAGTTTGTITPDSANGSVQSITLTGSITFSAFSNPVSGETITMIITQPASGGPYTLTSTMKFAGASKTLSTAANAIDILTVSYIGSTYYASLAKGFA
jgi:hypothetical protein